MKIRGPLGRNIKIVNFYCQRVRKSEDQAQCFAIEKQLQKKLNYRSGMQQKQSWYAKVKALFGKDWDSETMGWEYHD